MSKIRYKLIDDTHTSAEFEGENDYTELANIIKQDLKLHITEALDGIFEFYMDFNYKNRNFTFHWDDMMGCDLTFKELGLANETDKKMLKELCDQICEGKAAGPPRD